MASAGTVNAVAWVVVGIGIGGLAGWFGHATLTPPVERWVEVPVAVGAPTPTPAQTFDDPSITPARKESPPIVTPASPDPVPVLSDELDAQPEQAVIDRARVALRRGRPHDALVAVMNHERRFPSGILREERERLAIEALVGVGRTDQARARAEAFRADYPSSIYLAAVDAMVERIETAP